VGKEVGHGLLAQVEVQSRDLGAAVQQSRGEVDGDGGFPRPALLIYDDDHHGL
jgi:hypothetical protein